MDSFTIGEFKQQLPEILQQIAKGHSVILEKGRRHEKVAFLSPYQEVQNEPRKLAVFSARGKAKLKDWEMDSDEFFGVK